MCKCFHCGKQAVVWESDFSFEEYYNEGEGIVHILHCCHCGAHIVYSVPDDPEEAENE